MEQPVTDKAMHRAVDYWFPRRRYGWGWGCPRCWQGWAVLLAYALTLLGVHHLLADQQGSLGYAVAVLSVSAVLLWVCHRKGEPPHWTWGAQKDAPLPDVPQPRD